MAYLYQLKHHEVFKPLMLFIGFCASLGLLNMGMHQGLKPSTPLYSALPYVFEDLEGWQVESGDWQLRNGSLIQSKQGEARISSPLTLDQGNLRIRATVTEGVGINFFRQDKQAIAGSHLVHLRRQQGRILLVAGYIDTDGRFSKQAEQAVTSLEAESYTLSIETTANDYSVYVDDKRYFSALPLISSKGGLALISDQVGKIEGLVIDKTVLASNILEAETPLETEVENDPLIYQNDFSISLEREWRILSGNWRVKDGRLWQYISEGFDYTALYPERRDNYVLKIDFETTQGLGAGVFFNLPELESYKNGHLVRFTESEGTQGIFWGHFDETATFIGEGFVQLSVAQNQIHSLELEVGESQYSIRFNGEVVRDGLPLYSKEGYIGLTSSESVTAFDAIELRRLDIP